MNSAGYVRNHGIKFVTTEWIAFVDDDDTIRDTYVETFLTETATYDIDVIIFRMIKCEIVSMSIQKIFELVEKELAYIDESTYKIYRSMDPNTIIYTKTITPFPAKTIVDLTEDDVGISFAVKKHIFDSGIQFETSSKEDFELLENIKKHGYKIMISPFVLYYVKDSNGSKCENCNRVFFNVTTQEDTSLVS